MNYEHWLICISWSKSFEMLIPVLIFGEETGVRPDVN